MARLLLFLLAVLAAGIGYVIEFGWLYAVAAVLVLIAIGLWVRERMKERRRRERKAARNEATEEPDELRSLGIMEIRPREQQGDEEAGVRPQEAPEAVEVPDAPEGPRPVPEKTALEAPDATADVAPPLHEEEALEGRDAQNQAGEENTFEKDERAEEEEFAEPPLAEGELPEGELPAAESLGEGFVEARAHEDAPAAWLYSNQEALEALVRTARLTVGARTAVLLAQEELALDYRIEVLDAGREAPPLHEVGSTFSTEAPLLSASAARQAATHQPVGAGGVAPSLLGYYRRPDDTPPEAVALVPIPLPDDPTTRFLLLDGAHDLAEVRVVLLKRFASLFAELLAAAADDARPVRPDAEASTGDFRPASYASDAEAAARSENGRSASHDASAPRPRREIVAEEMEKSRAEGRPLALAFVYLNRAETVAERGEEEVEAAERALRARLRQAAPEERVERFGELTYGVFLRRGSVEAERWAVALQEELAEASDPLEGGTSVGLALMRGPEQPPETLRENATNALHEAYTTGTCTILE